MWLLLLIWKATEGVLWVWGEGFVRVLEAESKRLKAREEMVSRDLKRKGGSELLQGLGFLGFWGRSQGHFQQKMRGCLGGDGIFSRIQRDMELQCCISSLVILLSVLPLPSLARKRGTRVDPRPGSHLAQPNHPQDA